jgi:radical SAM superfamily enzyme YgiQ (UPF0313 family)
LLINPPGKVYVYPDGSPAHRKHCTPPLGLAYLAASARDAGYTPHIIDILAEGYSHEEFDAPFLVYGLPWNAIRQRVIDFAPDVVGISVLFSTVIREALEIARKIKEIFPDVPIVFGGQHPTGAAREVMAYPQVDYVMLGEADLSFPRLLDALNGRVPLKDVPALVYREDGAIHNTMDSVAPVVQGNGWFYFHRKDSGIPLDLDDLPMPAWDLFNFSNYWNTDVRYGGGDVARNRFIVMATTRGCPHACTFCTSPLNSGYKAYRKRSIESVIKEVRWLVETWGVEEIHFVDDNFNVGKAHAKKLMQRFIEEFPGILFSATGGTEVNAVDEDVADLMAKSGFYRVQLAIEAGDQDVQNASVDKKVNISRVPRVIEMLKSRGIEVRGLFMIGFPGETRQQIQRTLDLARGLDLDDFYISLVTPLPGTPLYDECLEKGLFTENYNMNDVRYSFSSIKLPDVSTQELESMRRTVWREAFDERQRRLAERGAPKHRHFVDRQTYEAAGFKTLMRK